VHVVVSGDRAGAIPTSLASSIQRRLVLRLANADDYGMLGVETDILDAASPAGRGILDGQETQIAVLGGDGNIAVQARKLEELAAAMTSAGISAAPPVERLAEQVALADVIGRAGQDAAVGLADDTLQPVGVEANGAFIIAGPPSSGRTTAIATLASSLASRADLKLYLISSRRSPLTRLGVWTAAADNLDGVERLVTDLAASLDAADPAPQSIALFIENIAEFAGAAVEYELERAVKGLLRTEQFVVGEGETSTWSQAYTLGQPLRAGRKGLLLQPDDGDGDLLLNTALPRIKRGSLPQGRGFLVARGRSRKVQVATP
jgi:S-DNA-T family DNA segregation ATPase FtsK/SpoIIIE